MRWWLFACLLALQTLPAAAQTAPLSLADFPAKGLFVPIETVRAEAQANLLSRALAEAERLSRQLPADPVVAQFAELRISNGSSVQVIFETYDLIGDATVVIATTEPDALQFLRQSDLEASGGKSAYLAVAAGTRLAIAVVTGSDSRAASASPLTIRVASPPPTLERTEIQSSPIESPDAVAPVETICSFTDDRVPASDSRVGRIMPIGCTGWLISPNTALTAGHCVAPGMDLLEFRVPASDPDGATRPAAVEDQYAILAGSIRSEFVPTRLGNDWAVFKIAPNTNTGALPAVAEQGYFILQSGGVPATIIVPGYGLDLDPIGATGGRNAQNQTEQQDLGAVRGPLGSEAEGLYFGHGADTMPANSGSPLVDALNPLVAIGIHTNGGCLQSGGENKATSLDNPDLRAAIADALAQP